LTRQESEHEPEAMKRLFTTCMVLGCLSFSFAQGLQGNVKLSGNATIAITGHSVTLTWRTSPNATSYNIYRGTASGGPYVKVASGIVDTTYTDVQVTHNQTLYYVTTAVNSNNESGYSNVAAAVIP
jgi:fibronectin type 3 domain-containing protein